MKRTALERKLLKLTVDRIGECDERRTKYCHCCFKVGVDCNLFGVETGYDYRRDMCIGLPECRKLRRGLGVLKEIDE